MCPMPKFQVLLINMTEENISQKFRLKNRRNKKLFLRRNKTYIYIYIYMISKRPEKNL